ncbi:hypothetical protein DDB_G0272312 [Dictyostelium discoideum AX4]|uniref:Uncharacterized protein n=1 Tax=Dictyostelium discoideum TaxID=44689 RepID=Q76P32_DICDI|nr:hypothetical protein DDB_G0272312 [Dictyostelium discoideum AX4]EAL71308.1 hypothetical protein DDB_G0272312 [Dictyostelium discoideum AX4]|eukprot:XP_645133.1 hypothetical protein DDB_G0272312 [Dictyostelium discoideum AX4]
MKKFNNESNGTIINPFQDLCILNNILQQSFYNFNNNYYENINFNQNNLNSIIKIYIGYGNYNLTCQSISISNFNNISISPYNFNQNQTIIENLFLNLENTNLIINGP